MSPGELRLLDHWTATTARRAMEVLNTTATLEPLAEVFTLAISAADRDDDEFREALVRLAGNCLARLVDLDTTTETLTEGPTR